MINKKNTCVFLLLTALPLFGGESHPPLKSIFKDHFYLGVAIANEASAATDPRGRELIVRNFNSITSENNMKMRKMIPAPSVYDFLKADEFVDFGVKNKMFMVGHTLVWHAGAPAWFFTDENGKDVSREILLERMKGYISKVVGRYKGRVPAWDVVNESFENDGTFRKSKWFEIIGEDYIEKAFEYAHKADPKAELYYNDFALFRTPKREAVIKMVKRLQAKNIPIHGVGEQGHYKLDWPSAKEIDLCIKDLAKLGIPVSITELDVSVLPRVNNFSGDVADKATYDLKADPFKAGLPDSVLAKLAVRYAEIFKVFKQNSASIKRVTFWNLTDGASWLNDFPVPGRTDYPLLFDRNYQPKLPPIKAIMESFN